MPERKAIRSGSTKSVTEIITPLYEANLNERGFLSPKYLLREMISVATTSSSKESVKIIRDLLSQKRPPKYRYIVYYLLEYFKDKLQGNKLFNGTIDEQAENIFSEIENHESDSNKIKNRYNNAPRLKVLTDLIFDLAIKRGFTAKTNQKGKISRIHASLIDANITWTRSTLCRDLFSEGSSRLDEQHFFTLALILLAEYDFIQQYLTRVLMRRDLNVWKIDEMLVFVLSRISNILPNDIYKSYKALYASYNRVGYTSISFQASSSSSEKTSQVLELTDSLLDELSKSAKSTAGNVIQITNEVETCFSQHKAFVNYNADCPHSPELKFSELNDEIRKALGASKRSCEVSAREWAEELICDKAELGNKITITPVIRDLIKEYHYPLASTESNIKNNKKHVTRAELLIAAFLDYTAQYSDAYTTCTLTKYQTPQEVMRIINSFIDNMNITLSQVGFDTIYLLNPLDCFLVCLVLTKDPFDLYFELWSRILNDDAKATAAKKATAIPKAKTAAMTKDKEE